MQTVLIGRYCGSSHDYAEHVEKFGSAKAVEKTSSSSHDGKRSDCLNYHEEVAQMLINGFDQQVRPAKWFGRSGRGGVINSIHTVFLSATSSFLTAA